MKWEKTSFDENAKSTMVKWMSGNSEKLRVKGNEWGMK